MKKAQIVGQIFIYITAIVIIGLIFLLGYNYVGKILEAKCDAEKTTFIHNLENYASKYNNYGEIVSERIKPPCNYKKVCFVDTEIIKSQIDLGSDVNQFIRYSVSSGQEKNIFLVGKDTEPVGYSDKISVTGDIICVDKLSGVFNIKFKGDGQKTFLETFE